MNLLLLLLKCFLALKYKWASDLQVEFGIIHSLVVSRIHLNLAISKVQPLNRGSLALLRERQKNFSQTLFMELRTQALSRENGLTLSILGDVGVLKPHFFPLAAQLQR